MTQPIHFGVTLPQIKRSWQQAREAATAFDKFGFDSVWVCDHLYGVPMPNLPILEGWTELAAVAALPDFSLAHVRSSRRARKSASTSSRLLECA